MAVHSNGRLFSLRSVFLSDQFLPKVSQDWEQVSTNGFLNRLSDGLLYLRKIRIVSGIDRSADDQLVASG